MGQKPSYSKDPFYQQAAWRNCRNTFLALPENQFCKPCERKGKLTKATIADHIIPKEQYQGSPYDFENLQGICAPCHGYKSQQEANAIPFHKKEIHIVWGPPCSGKSSYVKERRINGQIIIDIDLLHSALTDLPIHERDPEIVGVSISLRDYLIEYIQQPNKIKGAWLMTTSTDQTEVYSLTALLEAKLHKINRSKAQCLRFLYASGRNKRKEYEPVIDKFFHAFPDWGVE